MVKLHIRHWWKIRHAKIQFSLQDQGVGQQNCRKSGKLWHKHDLQQNSISVQRKLLIEHVTVKVTLSKYKQIQKVQLMMHIDPNEGQKCNK